MFSKKVNIVSKELILYMLILFILLLASINIDNFYRPEKVLGIKSPALENVDKKFWQDFLNKNPDYIPGLIEAGNFARAYELDPNYITP